MQKETPDRFQKVARFSRDHVAGISGPTMLSLLRRDGVRIVKLGRDWYARERDLEAWLRRQTEALDA